MLALVEGFRALEGRVRDTSNQKLPMFQKRGQLTPRQRLAHLIDRGSPFLELSTLAGLNMHDDDGAENIMGGGTIAGIGYVSGVRAMITASDSGIKGGTIAPMGLKKSLRVQEIALKCKLPLIGLVESGGANLNYQAEIFRRRRPHLCQHGPPLRRRHPAHHGGARLLHGRRRLSPGLERLRGGGQEALQDLPRRPAAAQGRHR